MKNIDYIHLLDQVKKEQDYKDGWLYNKFLLHSRNKVTHEDLTYIAKKSGYKDGWIYYKVDGHKVDQQTIRDEDEARFQEYYKAMQFTQGKDLPTNYDFYNDDKDDDIECLEVEVTCNNMYNIKFNKYGK